MRVNPPHLLHSMNERQRGARDLGQALVQRATVILNKGTRSEDTFAAHGSPPRVWPRCCHKARCCPAG